MFRHLFNAAQFYITAALTLFTMGSSSPPAETSLSFGVSPAIIVPLKHHNNFTVCIYRSKALYDEHKALNLSSGSPGVEVGRVTGTVDELHHIVRYDGSIPGSHLGSPLSLEPELLADHLGITPLNHQEEFFLSI